MSRLYSSFPFGSQAPDCAYLDSRLISSLCSQPMECEFLGSRLLSSLDSQPVEGELLESRLPSSFGSHGEMCEFLDLPEIGDEVSEFDL